MAAGQSRGTATSPNMTGVGIITAAAVVLILAGVLNAMQGVVALATNEFYVVTRRWLFEFDVTTWGWIHVLVGLIAAGAGFRAPVKRSETITANTQFAYAA